MRIVKSYRYQIDKTDFIRQALAGYAGGSAIASEMVQNADDAVASYISFHFRTDALVVQNDSVFTERDFVNICSIASGDKRTEEGKIGTWGTGFLSVFHVTDSPELLSAGQHIVFDPDQPELHARETQIRNRTVFRLPWRRQITELSTRLEAATWNEQTIQRLKSELAVEVYRLVLFLRHVKVIEVYEGDSDQKLLYRVERRLKDEQNKLDYRRETCEIEYRRAGVKPSVDSWLYYRTRVPRQVEVVGVTVKDREVAVAFPIENREWVAKNLPGTLYNFLPTPIVTGYPFQVNGAFFPDNNRRTILTDQDAHPEKSKWNHAVIETVGHLLADAVIDIRDKVAESRRFYELWPAVAPSYQLLRPVRDIFLAEVSDLRVVFTSQGNWELPGKVLVDRLGLIELAGDYLPVLPAGAPQDFRDLLINFLGARWLTWHEVVHYLQPRIRAGQHLLDAHPMIACREKLEQLYQALPSIPSAEQCDILGSTALCLTDDETLWPFYEDIWRGDTAARDLMADTGIRFADYRMQNKFPRLFTALVSEFQGAELVEWLSEQDWPETPIPILHAPSFIGDLDHLERILRFIHDDTKNVNRSNLSRLPLVRTEEDLLVSAGQVYRHNNTDERATLREIGLAFVHPDWMHDREIVAIYSLAGVQDLQVRDTIRALRTSLPDWSEPGIEDLIEQLTSLYGYLVRHRLQLRDVERGALQELPICLTQQGRLACARGADTPLHLPPRGQLGKNQSLRHLDRLQLDHLVHGGLLRDSTNRTFLSQILDVKTLDPSELIRDIIVTYYEDERLDHEARQDLLEYISEQARAMSEGQQHDLWPTLMKARLVRCDDDQYRPGQEVYFPLPVLDMTFPAGYHRLHPAYSVPIPGVEDEDQTCYRRSTWYWLFDSLGVNEHPLPADLVRVVEQTVRSGPPSAQRVETVKRVYDLLNREIGSNKSYSTSDQLKRLASLQWLPSQGDDAQWHEPKDVYQASQADFVGKQAPVLRFAETTISLREFLRMPRFPSVNIMAQHLLACAAMAQPVTPRLYPELGRGWDSLDHQIQSHLRREAVVWDNDKRFWPARHVFLSNHKFLFGARRCYLQPPGGDAQTFLEKIGVDGAPDGCKDSCALIKEIGATYSPDHPSAPEDRLLLLRNFDYLGKQIQQSGDQAHEQLQLLRDIAIVPGEDGELHPPNRVVLVDQPALLERFDRDMLPLVDEHGLTESAHQCLLALGVPLLSHLVERRAVDVRGTREDSPFSILLHNLAPAFERIALTLRDTQGDGDRLDVGLPQQILEQIRVYTCKNLQVAYTLNDGKGWQIEGYKRREPALYDKAHSILYVEQRQREEMYIPLSCELEHVLFPGSKESVVIEQLLRMHPAQVLRYLDQHGYRRLHEGPLDTPEEQQDEPLVVWEELELEDVPEETIRTEQPTDEDTEKTADLMPEPDRKQEATEDSTTEVTSPEQDVPPLAPEKTDLPPGKEPAIDTDVNQEVIPLFTGQRRPGVPLLPNNYGELEQKFGLTRYGNELSDDIGGSDAVDIDKDWVDEAETESQRKSGRVTQVRFTLTFTNRYQGFLPLHARARQMLSDRPRTLECNTDFDNWSFKLWVDYDEGLVYNQTDLPRFFEAYNIPAGGIVYLQRVHGNTVRLFWQRTTSRVEKVRCLELLEDGTLDEYEVPAAEFPCEVAEYVLRAEKRLEDPEALFKQAIDKRGAFQTICEVFGEAGRKLSYDEIYDGVMDKRRVAKATIDYQLQQRPCFVRLGDNRWQFQPDKGSEPGRAPGKRKPPEPERSQVENQGSQQQPDTHDQESVKPTNPYVEFFEEVKRDWEMVNDLFELNGRDPREHLQQVANHLATFAQRIQIALVDFSQEKSTDDHTLAFLWDRLQQDPTEQQNRRELLKYLRARINEESGILLLTQLQRQIVCTPADYRQHTFFPLLSNLATYAAEQGFDEFAIDLYQVLQQQGAGDFDVELEDLAQRERVRRIVEHGLPGLPPAKRLGLLAKTLEQNPSVPVLRQAIRQEVKDALVKTDEKVTNKLAAGDSHAAFRLCNNQLRQLVPLSEAWQNDTQILALVLDLARRVFDALMTFPGETVDHTTYREALQIVAATPAPMRLSGDAYLEAIQAVAETLEDQADYLAAAVLIEYGAFLVQEQNWVVDKYVIYKAHERASRLYESLGMAERAYDHLFQARQLAPRDQKKTLGNRIHAMKRTQSSRESDLTWRHQVRARVRKQDFRKLVNLSVFDSFVDQR